MRIDAHHHFWRYNPVEYEWISSEMEVIRRDFLPGDLEREIAGTGVEGVVSVQARQTLEETRWLLDLADAFDWIRGVVGWVPLTSPRVKDELDRLARQGKLKGVRHVLHDESDDEFMLRDDFNAGIRVLTTFDLVYDVLIFERHLERTIEFVDRHPAQFFVLDHLGKPRIGEGIFEPWQRHLRELAKRENVTCKLSGMVTEANWNTWTTEELRPYLEIALEAFGPNRLMFGSDWPVCLVATEYRRWIEAVDAFLAPLSTDERDAILGDTARRIYHLDKP